MHHDLAHATDRSNRWPTFVIRFPARLEQHHRNLPVTGQGVLQQVAIPRLKDVQRLNNVREHDQVRQRKQTHRFTAC